MDVNRFHGIENNSDIIFHKKVCENFETHDRNFQLMSRVKRDPVADMKKVLKHL